jgi:hypothetical protein
MLTLAQSVPQLALAKFVHGAAEMLDQLVAPQIDLVICNSAFWMMNMPATLRALAGVLSPYGLFAWSVPGYLIRDSVQHIPLGTSPSLMDAFVEAVRRDAPASTSKFHGAAYSISEDTLQRIATRAGLELVDRKDCSLLESVSTTYDALCIPALLDSYGAALPPDRRMPVLNAVMREQEDFPPTSVTWYFYIFQLIKEQERA